jgi:crossover junction endodeoxyribonuclease RusA
VDALMVTLELPYPPSVNSIWRFAGKSAYVSKQYAAWKAEADAWFTKQRSEKTVGTPIKGSYEVHMTFSDRKRRKNADLDNRIKVVGDALQRFGLIENDNKCEKLTATWGPCDGVFIRVFKPIGTSNGDGSKTSP